MRKVTVDIKFNYTFAYLMLAAMFVGMFAWFMLAN